MLLQEHTCAGVGGLFRCAGGPNTRASMPVWQCGDACKPRARTMAGRDQRPSTVRRAWSHIRYTMRHTPYSTATCGRLRVGSLASAAATGSGRRGVWIGHLAGLRRGDHDCRRMPHVRECPNLMFPKPPVIALTLSALTAGTVGRGRVAHQTLLSGRRTRGAGV